VDINILVIFQELLETEFDAMLLMSRDQIGKVLAELSNADDRSVVYVASKATYIRLLYG